MRVKLIKQEYLASKYWKTEKRGQSPVKTLQNFYNSFCYNSEQPFGVVWVATGSASMQMTSEVPNM